MSAGLPVRPPLVFPDGLVTGYGPFTFNRSGPAGAVSAISGGTLNMAITYDNLGRVAGRSHTVNGASIYSIQLSYDSRGNISQKTESVSGIATTWNYEYDADGQLITTSSNGVNVELQTYDPNGNRTGFKPQWSALTLSAEYDSQYRLLRRLVFNIFLSFIRLIPI